MPVVRRPHFVASNLRCVALRVGGMAKVAIHDN